MKTAVLILCAFLALSAFTASADRLYLTKFRCPFKCTKRTRVARRAQCRIECRVRDGAPKGAKCYMYRMVFVVNRRSISYRYCF